MMDLTVIVGPDHDGQRRARASALAGHTGIVERIDVTADGGDALVAAVAAPALFDDARVIEATGFEELSSTNLKTLKTLAAGTDAVVVARATKLGAALRKGLPRHRLIEAATATQRTYPADLRDRAREFGVTLNAELITLIAERCRDRPERGFDIISQLALVHILAPKRRQVEALLGSITPEVRPWEITDLLERGEHRDALTLTAQLSPDSRFGLLGYLRRQLTQLDAARRLDVRALAIHLGLTDQRAGHLARRATRVEPTTLRAALRATSRADLTLRGGDAEAAGAAVDLALIAYATCFIGAKVAR